MQNQRYSADNFRLKQAVTAALLFMLFGTATELFLLNHYEDTQQLIPLLLIAIAVVLLLSLFFKRSKLLEKIFKIVLGLTALSGLYGTYLHLIANFEFEQEMKPSATTGQLLFESLSGALPALAPCSMIVLALLGYSYLQLLKHIK